MQDEQRLREELAAENAESGNTTESLPDTDEQQILNLITKWNAALENKDVAAMMEDYAADAVLF